MVQASALGAEPASNSRTGVPKRKSPSDLRREARRLRERQDQARRDRGEFWHDRVTDAAYADAVERRQRKLARDKRNLRRDIYDRLPAVDPGEGAHVRTSSVSPAGDKPTSVSIHGHWPERRPRRKVSS